MRKTLLTLILGLVFSVNTYATGTIVLDGNYQGKNLYVQNPFASSGVGFCVFEVTVNGEVTTDEINSSAFEIDFRNFQLQLGEKVEVKIKHKDDCKPKVLNPEVLKPKSTFELISIDVSSGGVLNWSTKGETGKLPYVIEQFKWNKWVKVGEVEGSGTSTKNEYSFKVTAHSGKNKFRVKQVDYTGQPKYSQAAEYSSSMNEVTFSPVGTVKKDIIFSAETSFEVYDQYGNIVKKGFSKEIDCSNLQKGKYYMNYDNKMAEFTKK